MNVKEIRTRIERALTHAPGIDAWKDDVLDAINDAQRDIILAHQWTFRERSVSVWWPADRVFADTDVTLGSPGCDVTLASVFTTGWPELSAASAWRQGGVLDFTGHLTLQAGQAIAGKFTNAGGSDLDGVYPVMQFAVEHAAVSGLDLVVHLGARWDNSPGALTSGVDVTLRVHRLLLPWDCAEVLSLSDIAGKRGPLRAISNEHEARLMLRGNVNAGTPVCYMLDHSSRGVLDHDIQQYPRHLADHGRHRNPPTDTFAANDLGAAGTGLAAGTYEFCYTWIWHGIEGPRSEIVSVTIDAGDDISLTGMDTQAAYLTGRHRIIYWRHNRGQWVRAGQLIDPSVSGVASVSAAYDSFNPGDSTSNFDGDYVRLRHARVGNQAQWIRVWPRPAEDTRLELRYLAAPHDLECDLDVPDMPAVMHMLLVHRVVAQFAAHEESSGQASGLRAYHEKRERELMQTARGRYLELGPTRHSRRGVFAGGSGGGIPIGGINWTGD